MKSFTTILVRHLRGDRSTMAQVRAWKGTALELGWRLRDVMLKDNTYSPDPRDYMQELTGEFMQLALDHHVAWGIVAEQLLEAVEAKRRNREKVNQGR